MVSSDLPVSDLFFSGIIRAVSTRTSRRLEARLKAKPLVYTGFFLLVVSVLSLAQRAPVLNQIDAPHPYYFREMYLPQLTTGPSSLAWSPDSRSVVYSMAGSLWLQQIDSQTAEQLTAGPGYDYQPDWSSDGQWIVYAKYNQDAVALWVLDVQSKKARALTEGNAVNVEPRFSPDGKRIAFVSTSYHGRFHIFAGRFEESSLREVRRLTGENRSSLPRYYYSAFDHEISPVWSPDGSQLLFVSNRGHLYGTGGFWRMKAQPGAEAREIHYEETSWKARPDFSPDGSRVIYSSYLGRQWQNLWLMPAKGGDAFPISYGDWDDTNARWSPDGKQLAYISNRDGDTQIWTRTILGGTAKRIRTGRRRELHPHSEITVRVLDLAGRTVPARLSVTDATGKFYAPHH